ncbi:MAG: molybdopterin molybdotransferase MoeA [Clostridiales bacterium]|nr:molybdopterin molybdotransferase MoeA [Clostridiales bacterium]
MRLYNVHTLSETEALIKSHFKSFETEVVSLDNLLNRVLAKDVYASIQVPSFRRSTVDGYAVHAADTNGASDTMPMLLKDTGSIEMGQASETVLHLNETIYVPTGGMVPDDADAMVMIEYTERFSEDTIGIMKQALPLQHIVGAGSDIKINDKILSKGLRLKARHIGALAASGIFEVEVYKKITATIISTGDELITTEQPLKIGEVFDINTHTLKHQAAVLDIEVLKTHVLKDQRELIKSMIEEGVRTSDITIISGGSSVGEKDYTADIIDELGDEAGVLIHGLAIKPGKPTIVGKVMNKLVLGLPGHPVSSLIVFDQLIRMYLGQVHDYRYHTVKGCLTQNVHAAAGKETFVMVTIEGDEIIPVLGKSGMITMMSRADGYIRIEANQEGLDKGESVTVYLLD